MSANNEHFADRLHAASREKGAPVCVGLDPVLDRLPDELKQQMKDPVQAIETFCHAVIETVAAHVPCVKVQSACFERYRAPGFEAMFRVIEAARRHGLVTILDAKRGDIGISASHYAAGLLTGENSADALTVHSYLGDDSLQPFIDVAAREGKGLFPLVRTSNPGGDGLQGLALHDGRTVGEAVADMVAQLGAQQACLSASGNSLLGAVVGATKPSEFVTLRRQMWRQIFLVPGFGAQGGDVASLRHCFRADGSGAIISASRSIIYAYGDGGDTLWRDAIATAASDFHKQIAGILDGDRERG